MGVMGASAGGVQAMRQGVANPREYIDAAVRTGLRSLGCNAARCDQRARFSYAHPTAWTSGENQPFTPV
jgi:hypothetical protein